MNAAAMTPAVKLLIRTLAAQDALHAPQRTWGRRGPAAVLYHARNAFRELGVRLRESGLSRQQKQTRVGVLNDVAAKGLLVITTGFGSRFIHAKLTERGDQHARAIAALPNIDCALETVAELHRLADDPGSTVNGDWTPETILMGFDYHERQEPQVRREMQLVEMLSYPALVRGWVEANSDMRGRVYYRLTPAGQAIAGGRMQPPEPIAPPHAHDNAGAYYWRAFSAELHRLESEQTEYSAEVGFLPLSASSIARGGAGAPI